MVLSLQNNLLIIQNEICITSINLVRSESKLHQLRSNLIHLDSHLKEIRSNLSHLRHTKIKLRRLLSLLRDTTPIIIHDPTNMQAQSPSTSHMSQPNQGQRPVTSNDLPITHFNRELHTIRFCINGFRNGLRQTRKTIQTTRDQIALLDRKRDILKYNLQRHHIIELDTIRLMFQQSTDF